MQDISIDGLVEEYGELGLQEIKTDLGITSLKSIRCAFNDHDDKNPSMGLIKGTYKLWCQGCQRQYDIINHYEEHSGMTKFEAINSIKEKLGYNFEINETNIKQRVKEEKKQNDTLIGLKKIFEAIGISQETIIDNKIDLYHKNGRKYIGVTYNDLEGQFKSYQYIDPFTLKQKMKGQENLLYNYENIKDKEKIIICFDLMDYLTLYDLGYRNICSKSTKGNGFVANYYDELKKHKEIKLIFGDAISEYTFEGIAKRIGEEVVKYSRIKGYENVNEASMCGEDVKSYIDKAQYMQIKDMINFDEIELTDQTSPYYIPTGFRGIDYHLNDLRAGELTVIGGKDNSGKSTILAQIISSIIDNGEKVFSYCGELTIQKYKRWIYSQVIGKDKNAYNYIQDNKRKIKKYKPAVLEVMSDWHKNKLYIYNNMEVGTGHTAIFKKMVQMHKRHGIKVFVIDNLSSIISVNDNGKYTAEGNFVKELCKIKNKYGLHIILVTHPNKANSDNNKTLETNSISGNKNITNLADNVIILMRIYENDEGEFILGNKRYTKGETLRIDITKDRVDGQKRSYYFTFDNETKRFMELHNGDYLNKNYLWNKNMPKHINPKTYDYIRVDEEKAKQLRGEELSDPF